jgi:Flp pilus assembly protein TadD
MCFLACLVLGLFHPIVDFEFVNLDVPDQVAGNVYIREITAENLKHIFTTRCMTSYYPIRTLTFAVDYQLWGSGPGGFKRTNMLIHLANVWLVFGLIWRLFRRPTEVETFRGRCWDASAAALGAGLFAVHPVVVEPVTWVAGREELLMTLGALACIHFHLTAHARADRGEPGRVWPMDLAAALACAAACLSNAVGAVIPTIITAWGVLMLRRPKWKRIAVSTFPLWAIGLATVALKVWADSQTYSDDVSLPFWRNALVVPKTLWLNVKTVVWPTGLTVDYWDDIPNSVADGKVLLGVIALLVLLVVLWSLRDQRRLMFGAAWFCLAMGPSSQIMPHHIMRADRFLYLPLVGIAMVLALGMRRFFQKSRGVGSVAGVGLAVTGISLLIGISSRQLQTWRNSVSLWEQCVRICSTNGVGYAHLADALAEEGKFEQARPIFEQALKLDPVNPHFMATYAYRLSMCRQEESRDYGRAIELATQSCRIVHWQIPEYRRILSMAQMNRATALCRAGQFRPAIESYRAAIQADPDYQAAAFNLALLLASCQDDRLRDPEGAVKLAEEATRAGGGTSLHLSILAEVYASTGRLDEAASALEKAILAAERGGDSKTLDALTIRREQLRSVSPATTD